MSHNEKIITVLKSKIDKDGFPDKKEHCPLREFMYLSNQFGTSNRKTYTCKVRGGLFLSSWKCIGLSHSECPMKIANELSTTPSIRVK